MFQLANVLFPVDFSSRCRGAARLLDALHANFQLNVTLVHVLPPPHMEYSMADLGGGVFQEYTKAREDQARKDLDYFLDEELKHYTLNRILLEGDPARKLIEYAQENNTHLIVMPTHGYGGFRRFMLGSVTAKVLHDSDCPVFTGVHLEDVPDSSEVKIRHVAAAIDLQPPSESVLRWASCFAQKCKAHLSVYHVTPSVEGMSGEYFVPNWRERFAEEAGARMEELMQKTSVHAPVEMTAGDAVTNVCELAKRDNADLLVIGRGSSSGVLGRIRAHSYGIIRQSPCPVISV